MASSTEPSSPAVSESYSHDTPSGEFSISITSTEGPNVLHAPERLARFFPQLDDDLNSVSIFSPMNMDTLDVDTDNVFLGGSGSSRGDKSACLTPVSCGMDISMIVNKGSMTGSIDGFEDDDEATLSAATTPSLPTDEPKLETCYCCPAHAEQGQPPDVEDFENETQQHVKPKIPEPLSIPNTNVISCSPEHVRGAPQSPSNLTEPLKPCIRKASDPISPRIQKQISLFESGDIERQKEHPNLHASINLPTAPMPQQLKQDSRLRKFEVLTQSTSNSNFPFESNTLKRVPLNVNELIEMEHTQSLLNLKSSPHCLSLSSSVSNSPHKLPQTTATVPESPRPGALVVKEKFIEPPKRLAARSLHHKTQSMDADFLFNEFLLVPANAPSLAQLTNMPKNSTSSLNTSPSARPSTRFTATRVVDDLATLSRK